METSNRVSKAGKECVVLASPLLRSRTLTVIVLLPVAVVEVTRARSSSKLACIASCHVIWCVPYRSCVVCRLAVVCAMAGEVHHAVRCICWVTMMQCHAG